MVTGGYRPSGRKRYGWGGSGQGRGEVRRRGGAVGSGGQELKTGGI